MKIINLIIENVMKIRAVHIIPKSDVIEIKGDNAAGKSSILDAIVIAFKGDRDLPKQPIHKGAKKGKIEVQLDGDTAAGIPPFTITRTITEKGAYINIEPTTVLSGETPRSFLDKLIGKISFDPLAFINEEGKKQRKILMELAGIDVDTIDKQEKAIFDERTIKGRELKTAEAKVKGLRVWPEVKEKEEVKMVELSEKLTKATSHNQTIINRQTANNFIKDRALQNKAKIEEMESELSELKKMFETQREKFNTEKAAIAELVPIIIDDINTEISEIESKNSKIRDNATYLSENKALATVKTSYNNLDTKLDTCRANRLKLIQEANIPVPGLTFDEDGLLYNNIPLSQCSDGEKLMVGMGMSMALNPTMRVLRIKDGSLLGPKNMAILRSMVKDKGYQLWLEKVQGKDEYDKAGKVGIFIEEGEAEGEEIISVEPEPELDVKDKEPKKEYKKAQLKDDDF